MFTFYLPAKLVFLRLLVHVELLDFVGFCPGGNWVRWSLPAKNAGSACWSDPGIHLVLLDSELSIQSTFAIVYIFLHLYICITYLKCIIYVYICLHYSIHSIQFFRTEFPKWYVFVVYHAIFPGEHESGEKNANWKAVGGGGFRLAGTWHHLKGWQGTLWIQRSHGDRWNDIPIFNRIHRNTSSFGVLFSSQIMLVYQSVSPQGTNISHFWKRKNHLQNLARWWVI